VAVSELLPFAGFSQLTRAQRFARLLAAGALTAADVAYLNAGGVQDHQLAEQLIENALGYFQLPLGVATHFCIDEQDYVIPLAVEETSIIAALSKTAKWIKTHGKISTRVEGECILGQIQCPQVTDLAKFSQLIAERRLQWVSDVNQLVVPSMRARGGGVQDVYLRSLPHPHGGLMAIVHVTMNTCEAMGANVMNQVLEYLKERIAVESGEVLLMSILSNLNDQKITVAEVLLPGVDGELGARLQEASWFAESDPYRAATHNKGVMNGIDPVAIATGNDWRALEAGVHAFAAQSGQYRAISQWRYASGVLHGVLRAPLVVGIVGGVTGLHPTAQLCLRMMKITSANQLSRVLAAVGLVQNLGALRALCTEGITNGHMRLHIANLLLNAGATAEEMPLLTAQMQAYLAQHGRVSLTQASALVAAKRAAHGA
jgi:hydroxymethylglutaryl-CoA reductase